MRVIIGYVSGRPVWSENIPSEVPEWGMALGGRRIEEAPSAADRQRAAKDRWAQAKRLRGTGLEP